MVLELSIVVVAACAILVRDGNVPGWEADLFNWLNGIPLPSGACGTVDTLQDAGNLLAPVVVALVLLVFRRYWTAALLIVALGLKQLIEFELVKEAVERERPKHVQLDPDVRCGAPSEKELAFPSGHAIVLFFTAAFVASVLPHRWRQWTWVPYAVSDGAHHFARSNRGSQPTRRGCRCRDRAWNRCGLQSRLRRLVSLHRDQR